METFISTSDGKYPCLRYKDGLHYCSPDELAQKFGIVEYEIVLDPAQRERDIAEERRRAARAYNAGLPEPWGF